MTQGLVLAGSLAAVLGMAGLAHWLGLGGDRRIADENEARAIAGHYHFEPAEIVVDRARVAALAHDGANGFMLIRRHGAQFLGERLVPPLHARLDQRFLTIGRTVLNLGDAAPVWAARLRSLV